jgi:hypothetical protein
MRMEESLRHFENPRNLPFAYHTDFRTDTYRPVSKTQIFYFRIPILFETRRELERKPLAIVNGTQHSAYNITSMSKLQLF